MQERLTDIEVKLAHMEAALHDLSDTVYAQQGMLDRLMRLCAELQQRLTMAGGGAEISPDNEPPPHY